METAFVLSADKWELTDENTGEIRKGVTVQFVTDYREPSPRSVGLKPVKTSATEEAFEAIRQEGAPGLYSLEFRTRPGKEGKPTVLLVSAKSVRNVPLFSPSDQKASS